MRMTSSIETGIGPSESLTNGGWDETLHNIAPYNDLGQVDAMLYGGAVAEVVDNDEKYIYHECCIHDIIPRSVWNL